MAEEGRRSTVRGVGAVGGIIAALAGAVTLLFSVRPDLQPCLGGADATFTGAPVFPRVRYRAHLVRNGVKREDAAQQPNLVGAEVRFSYHTSGLRGQVLTITYSLVTIERDGTLGSVQPIEDRAVAQTVKPDACSSNSGMDLFVQIPKPHTRYQVVLELYRHNDPLRDRIALAETPAFRG